jgi:hypothetical protein
MQYLLLLITTMSACVASAMHIEKREDNQLTCSTPASCVSSYLTGSAQCSSGYTGTHYEVRGSPPGTYCEKACESSERDKCMAKQCTFFKDRCTLYPASEDCGKAIDWCRTPMKTTKDNCVEARMGQPVTYNDNDGTCATYPDAPKYGYILQFTMKTQYSINSPLLLSCNPVTKAGAKSISAEMEKVVYTCSQNSVPENTTPYEIQWRCFNTPLTDFDYFKDVFAKACAIAAHPGNTTPTFEWSRQRW